MYQTGLQVDREGSLAVLKPLRQRLEEQLSNAKDRVTAIESALKFMNDNPSFEEFHNIIGKVGY